MTNRVEIWTPGMELAPGMVYHQGMIDRDTPNERPQYCVIEGLSFVAGRVILELRPVEGGTTGVYVYADTVKLPILAPGPLLSELQTVSVEKTPESTLASTDRVVTCQIRRTEIRRVQDGQAGGRFTMTVPAVTVTSPTGRSVTVAHSALPADLARLATIGRAGRTAQVRVSTLATLADLARQAS